MKNRYVLLLDLPLIAISAWGAFAARFDWRFYEERPEFAAFLLAALVVKPVVFFTLGMYRRYWRYASIQELALVVIGVSLASVGMAIFVGAMTVLELLEPTGFSRVVLMTDWLLTLATAGGMRMAIRVVHEAGFPKHTGAEGRVPRRTLVVGAGAAGTMVAREMRRNPQLGMEPVGFLDDDTEKLGKHMAGLRVLAPIEMLPAVVRAHRIDSVVIAMPTAPGRAVRTILKMCNESGVKSQTIPGMFELLDGQVSVNRLRNVEITDLLRRSPVAASQTLEFVTGRVVMITGAGGSIGSELARQVANAAPAHLILLGHGENSIFECEARLRRAYPAVRLSTVIADVRDARRIEVIFNRFRPELLFHAAAHKHVPLMEENPEEAITNNVVGTRNVVNAALAANIGRLVLISTDKAVSPSSIMGATKRIAEAIVRQAARQSGRAYVAVRFGNVLGSRGSVVTTFRSQIEHGGPVTVTHPEMTRYFMTIPEAVYLVLQASGKGRGGELYVLDMGEPVKIVDLAQDLIRLSGLTTDDIGIEFTGMRAGEKMAEVLFDPGMQTIPTSHPEVLEVAGLDSCMATDLDTLITQLRDAAERCDRPAIDACLSATIPGYLRPAAEVTIQIPVPPHSRIH